jgi:hypothetical protein
MADLLTDVAVALTGQDRYRSAAFDLAAQTSVVIFEADRTWPAQTTLRATIVVQAGGEEFYAISESTGGDRFTRQTGALETVWRLSYILPNGFFGARSGFPKRLGEEKGALRAWVELEIVRGSTLATTIRLSTNEAPALGPRHHSSVAYDNASGTFEASGDKVLSWSHTASGSNRAALVGTFFEQTAGSGITSSAATYAGNAHDSQPFADDLPTANWQWLAGHVFKEAKIPTGAQTVTVTITSGANASSHGGGVVTVTGVDQTTPVGTAPTIDSALSGTTPSVTVASLDSAGLIVDVLGCFAESGTPTAGANQTSRTLQQSGSFITGMSTQLSSDGGVMSWTKSSNFEYALGAVEFKPVAAAAAVVTPNPTLVRPFPYAPSTARGRM